MSKVISLTLILTLLFSMTSFAQTFDNQREIDEMFNLAIETLNSNSNKIDYLKMEIIISILPTLVFVTVAYLVIMAVVGIIKLIRMELMKNFKKILISISIAYVVVVAILIVVANFLPDGSSVTNEVATLIEFSHIDI